MTDAFICDAVRTPIGRYGGALASVRPDDLGAIPLRALKERNPGIDWTLVAGGVESMSRAPFVTPKADTAFSRASRLDARDRRECRRRIERV